MDYVTGAQQGYPSRQHNISIYYCYFIYIPLLCLAYGQDRGAKGAMSEDSVSLFEFIAFVL